MLARPLVMCCSPQAIKTQGNSALAMAMTRNGKSLTFQSWLSSRLRVATMITASATAPDADRISTSTTGLMSWTASLIRRKDAPQISPNAVKARYGRTGFLGSGTGQPLVGGKHKRDRAVVLDAHTHDRSKATGPGFYSALPKTGDERFVELLGAGRVACAEEARAPPAAHVRKEGELRHDQRRTLHVDEAEVHLARLVGEDAEVDD